MLSRLFTHLKSLTSRLITKLCGHLKRWTTPLTKRIVAADHASRNGTYSEFMSGEPGIELFGQRLGLVGFGRIGRHVAKVALAVGMIVSAYNPLIPALHIEELGVEAAPTLEALLNTADIVSLHVPTMPCLVWLSCLISEHSYAKTINRSNLT